MEVTMPYKASKNWTMVKRGDRWVKLKQHQTHEEAVKHAQALNINVSQSREKKKSRK